MTGCDQWRGVCVCVGGCMRRRLVRCWLRESYNNWNLTHKHSSFIVSTSLHYHQKQHHPFNVPQISLSEWTWSIPNQRRSNTVQFLPQQFSCPKANNGVCIRGTLNRIRSYRARIPVNAIIEWRFHLVGNIILLPLAALGSEPKHLTRHTCSTSRGDQSA